MLLNKGKPDDLKIKEVTDSAEAHLPVSWQAISLAIIVTVIFGYMTLYGFIAELTPRIHISWIMPSPGGTGVFLIVLLLLNPLLKLISKKKVFKQRDLLAFYGLLTISATSIFFMAQSFYAIVCLPYMNILKPSTYKPIYDSISSLVVLKDEDAFISFMQGESAVPWSAWFLPVLMWTLFGVAVFLASQSIAVMVRRRWEEHERLSYPLVMPFVEMTEDVNGTEALFGSLWKDKVMWIGFGIALLFAGLIALNRYFPAVPYLAREWPTNTQKKLFTGKPYFPGAWHYAANQPTLEPLYIGLGYLVSLDILFTAPLAAWGFVALKAILMQSAGWTTTAVRGLQSPVLHGSYLALGFAQIWLLRKEFAYVFKSAFSSRKTGDNSSESQEEASYRKAVFGLLGSTIFITLFMWLLLGMNPFMAFAFFVIYLIALLGSTRARAEAGIGYQAGWGSRHSTDTYLNWLGIKKFGMSNLNAFNIVSYPLENSYIGGIMGSISDAYKMGTVGKIKRSSLSKAMLVTFAVASLIMAILILNFTYSIGQNNMPAGYFGTNKTLLESSIPQALAGRPEANGTHVIYLIGSLLFTLFLSYMRTQFVWWPFNPIGYFIGVGYMRTYTFNFLVAGIVKALILRLGGYSLHKRARNFFIGLMLGDLFVQGLASLIGLIVGY